MPNEFKNRSYDLSHISEITQLDSALSILTNLNEALIDNFKQVMIQVEQLDLVLEPTDNQVNTVVKTIQAMLFKANYINELANHTYTLCCKSQHSQQQASIFAQQQVELINGVQLDVKALNPMIKTDVTETVSQGCFTMAHVYQTLEQLPDKITQDDSVQVELNTALNLLVSLQVAFYLSYMATSNQTQDASHQAKPLMLLASVQSSTSMSDHVTGSL